MRFVPQSVIKSFSSEEDLTNPGTPRHVYRNTTRGTLFLDRSDGRQVELVQRCFEANFPVISDEVEPFEPSPTLRVGARRIIGIEEIDKFLLTQP